MVTPALGPVIVSVPVWSLSSSWPRAGSRLIVCGVLNTFLSNVIDSAPPFVFARAIAWRRSVLPATGVSVGLLTTIVDRARVPPVPEKSAAFATVAVRGTYPARPSADPASRCDSSCCCSQSAMPQNLPLGIHEIPLSLEPHSLTKLLRDVESFSAAAEKWCQNSESLLKSFDSLENGMPESWFHNPFSHEDLGRQKS